MSTFNFEDYIRSANFDGGYSYYFDSNLTRKFKAQDNYEVFSLLEKSQLPSLKLRA